MTLIFILDSRIPTVLTRWIDLCRKAHRKIDTTEAGCEESRPAFFIADSKANVYTGFIQLTTFDYTQLLTGVKVLHALSLDIAQLPSPQLILWIT